MAGRFEAALMHALYCSHCMLHGVSAQAWMAMSDPAINKVNAIEVLTGFMRSLLQNGAVSRKRAEGRLSVPAKSAMVKSITSAAFLLFAIAGSIVGERLDIGREHPPDVTRTFSGIVQRIDTKTLTVVRPNEKHIFLIGDCSEAHRVKIPATALHRPVLVTYVGGVEPYCAIKVEVLTALPKPTPKQEDTPTYYMTGVTRSLKGDHLIIRTAVGTHKFVIDVLTVYYDRQGYVIVNPRPVKDLPDGTRVKLGYIGKREPFRAVSVEVLK